jgi:flagellar basal-body rod modification protein FlgD
MDTITSALPIDTAQATSGVQAQAKAKDSQNEFLQLLVAQLKGQNPLDPMDGSAFVAQLAQFSSLEELQKLPCPDAVVVQSELDRQVTCDAELTKQTGNIALQMAAREAALASGSRMVVTSEAMASKAYSRAVSAIVPLRSITTRSARPGDGLRPAPGRLPPRPCLARNDVAVLGAQ